MYTGIERSKLTPFAVWSTFKTGSISIPFAMFSGGIFYFDPSVELPLRISYMDPATTNALGVWGLADRTGAAVGEMIFKEHGDTVLGDIVTPSGVYAGCVKASERYYNSVDETSIGAFLLSIRTRLELDSTSLIIEPGLCASVDYTATTGSGTVTEVVLPADAVLSYDSNDNVYIERTVEGNSTDSTALRSLILSAGSSSCELGADNIVITPSHDVINSSYAIPGGDVRVVAVDDTIIIADRHNTSELLS